MYFVLLHFICEKLDFLKNTKNEEFHTVGGIIIVKESAFCNLDAI